MPESADAASAVTGGSRSFRIALGGGAIALLVGALAFVARDGDSDSPPADTSTSSTTLALREETEVISVEGGPTTLVAGDGAIWVLTEENTLSRIDPLTNQVAASTDIGDADDRAVRLAAGEGAVWVAVQDESGEDDDAVVRVDPSTNEVVDRISVGLDPTGISPAEGAVWVANSGDDTVSRIDPDTNQVTDTIGVGAEPVAVAAGEGAVWVANRNGRTVSRIDPVINAVTDTLAVDTSPNGGGAVGPWDLAMGEGAVWVTASDFDDYTDEDGVLFRIDPESAEVTGATSTCPAGSVCGDPSDWGGVGWPGTFPDGVAAGDGAVWLTNSTDSADGDSVWRIDPDTGDVIDLIGVGDDPQSIAVGEGAVWVANTDDSTVSRIGMPDNDSDEDATTTTNPGAGDNAIPVGREPHGVAYGASAVWVANSGDNTVSRIDPDTNQVTATVTVGAAPEDLAVGLGAVWVANSGDNTVSRIDPDTDQVDATITNVPDSNEFEFSGTAGHPVGGGAIAIGNGAVWVANTGDDSAFSGGGFVARIDPQSKEVVSTFTGLALPVDVAFGFESLWVASRRPSDLTAEPEWLLSRVDPDTGDVTGTINFYGSPIDIGTGTADVWSTSEDDMSPPALLSIDPDTLEQMSLGGLELQPHGVAIGGGDAAR